MAQAKITVPSFCPYCKEEIPQDKVKPNQNRCPECFRIIVKPEDKYFKSPEYISKQKVILIERVVRDVPNGPNNYEDLEDATAQVYLAEDDWYRNCLASERFECLWDALGILRHLPYSKMNREDTQRIVSMGKKIGEVATKIDEMYKAGVVLYDREVRSARPDPRETDLDQASTATGRDT